MKFEITLDDETTKKFLEENINSIPKEDKLNIMGDVFREWLFVHPDIITRNLFKKTTDHWDNTEYKGTDELTELIKSIMNDGGYLKTIADKVHKSIDENMVEIIAMILKESMYSSIFDNLSNSLSGINKRHEIMNRVENRIADRIHRGY